MTTKRAKQLEVLMEMSVLVNSSLDSLHIRQQAIHALINLMDTEAGSLLMLDEERLELFFDVALGNKSDALKQIRLKRGEGIAGWVAEHGEPQIVHDVGSDPRFFSAADRLTGFTTRNMVCVPLTIQGKVIGVLQAINKKNGQFENDDMKVLGALSNQVAIALENARLHTENLNRLNEMLAKEKRHLREKDTLIRDLHDCIGGITANISILSELALKSNNIDNIKKDLTTIAKLSRDGMEDIRSFMNTLDNKESTWQEMASEFRCYGTTITEPHTISFSMDTTQVTSDEKPGLFIYLMICRIYREALTNIIKHARAEHVNVILSVNPEQLLLTINDDGIGFNESVVMGRGIANMKSRAIEIGGKLTISSHQGVSIQLEMPLSHTVPIADEAAAGRPI